MKLTKGQAYYRVADIPGECCGNCRFFRKRERYANGLCMLVEGVIEPEDTCNLWKGMTATWVSLGVMIVFGWAAYLLSKRKRPPLNNEGL